MSMKLNLRGAKRLSKALDDMPRAKVGVLAGKNSREGVSNNATIGYKHEFGIDVTKRSFIREPLIVNFKDKMQKAGFSEDTIEKIVDEASFKELLNKMGIVGVSTIHDAFNSGFNWAPHSPNYSNRTGQILVDTQQLRNSITWEVIGG